uniref:INCENP_ARK-bind domain-containing protein n=1 Tax=Syphacia muris TaxID=451379 RepID=A0A0N5AI66_9BILA
MGRIRNSPKKDPLKKRTSVGGVLSAAEKRQRMIDAGKRFVMKSVHHLSPARISSKVNKHTAIIKKSLLKKEDSYASKLLSNADSSRSVSRIRSLPRPNNSVLRQSKKDRCGYQSCDDELFKKDENSISEILNHRPISRSAGRLSQLRQNRPSFFPNGVNPVDKPTLDSIPPKKPPRTFKELHVNIVNIQSKTALDCDAGASCSKIISSLKKTPVLIAKSVRFAEGSIRHSSVKSNDNKWAFMDDLVQFMDGANNVDLEKFFAAFPRQTFNKLQESISRFSNKNVVGNEECGHSLRPSATLRKIEEEEKGSSSKSGVETERPELVKSCQAKTIPVTGIVVNNFFIYIISMFLLEV